MNPKHSWHENLLIFVFNGSYLLSIQLFEFFGFCSFRKTLLALNKRLAFHENLLLIVKICYKNRFLLKIDYTHFTFQYKTY